MEGDLGMSLNAPSGGIRANLHFVRQKKIKKSKSRTNLKKKRNNEKNRRSTMESMYEDYSRLKGFTDLHKDYIW
jgi:hypothetical protein